MKKVKFTRIEKVLTFVDCEIDIPDDIPGNTYEEYIQDHQHQVTDIKIEDSIEDPYNQVQIYSGRSLPDSDNDDLECPF